MKMSFTVVSNGNSTIDQYVNNNGKVVVNKKAGDVVDSMVRIASSAISESSSIERQRTIYMASVFFQRVVNRTPVDEDYWYLDKKSDDMKFHRADEDSVRELWEIFGPGFKFTARDFINNRVSFDEFNSKSDIDKIYVSIRDAAGGNRNFYVIIKNVHKRFSQLEFGEYLKDGDLKKGQKYYHGVERGYSVQAPYGMLRITQAEFGRIKLSSSTEKLIREYVRRSARVTKIPSKSKVKRLRSLIENRTHLSNSDIDSIERTL